MHGLCQFAALPATPPLSLIEHVVASQTGRCAREGFKRAEPYSHAARSSLSTCRVAGNLAQGDGANFQPPTPPSFQQPAALKGTHCAENSVAVKDPTFSPCSLNIHSLYRPALPPDICGNASRLSSLAIDNNNFSGFLDLTFCKKLTYVAAKKAAEDLKRGGWKGSSPKASQLLSVEMALAQPVLPTPCVALSIPCWACSTSTGTGFRLTGRRVA
eukprot:1157764-Pelagomonas_calceolata.AAC.17